MIKSVDLLLQHNLIRDELNEAINRVIDNSSFIRGVEVDHFENEFSNLLGVNECISCGNGTDSLYIIMKSLNVGPMDEVIVPAMSWISTSETVTQAGAKVVFCDIDQTGTISIAELLKKITPRTVGIIPVHLYGQPCDMDAIMEIANQRNLWVVEDCAQSHLAKYKGKYVGTFGRASSFSFYPGKNLGAIGDAGAILTNDYVLADKMKKFARHGGLVKGNHEIEGINSRMDGLQAAVLNVKLNYILDWTRKRQYLANLYMSFLKDVKGLVLPLIINDREHVWHLFVIQHPERDEMRKYLKENDIETAINYPIALPFLPAYDRLGHVSSDFPIAFNFQDNVLSLPMFPELTVDQVEYISLKIREFCHLNY